jgi:hypothetical protein
MAYNQKTLALIPLFFKAEDSTQHRKRNNTYASNHGGTLYMCATGDPQQKKRDDLKF